MQMEYLVRISLSDDSWDVNMLGVEDQPGSEAEREPEAESRV